MSKFGTIVMGPAGAGKTTFCTALIQHLQHCKRSCFYINLDPAAEDFAYEPDLDIRELITLEDVMEDMDLGPNGGLIECFEFLLTNPSFLTAPLDPLPETTLIILDLPGQIELYTHIPLIPRLIRHLTSAGSLGISLCATYLLESTSLLDTARFFAGTLSAMSAMLLLEIPHVNVMSKMDLVKGVIGKKRLKRFIDPDIHLLDEDEGVAAAGGTNVGDGKDGDELFRVPPALRGASEEGKGEGEGEGSAAAGPGNSEAVMTGRSFKALNRAVGQLVDEFSMVSFLQLDANDEDTVSAVLAYIDDAIQYHEAQEPREPGDEVEMGDGDGDGNGGAYWENGG